MILFRTFLLVFVFCTGAWSQAQQTRAAETLTQALKLELAGALLSDGPELETIGALYVEPPIASDRVWIVKSFVTAPPKSLKGGKTSVSAQFEVRCELVGRKLKVNPERSRKKSERYTLEGAPGSERVVDTSQVMKVSLDAISKHFARLEASAEPSDQKALSSLRAEIESKCR